MDNIPAERLVLASGYAEADAPGIYAFGFDEQSGALRPRGAHAGIVNPSFLLAHPHKPWLYAVSEGVEGAVCALALEREPFALRQLGAQPSGGAHPCHLALDPHGHWLAVANYTGGSVTVLPIRPDGTLGPAAAHIQHSGSGPHTTRQEGPHAHSALFTPDGRHLIVADLGLDALLIYHFDTATGALTPHQRAASQPGAGPRHLAMHPAGHLLYVANELDNTVSLYSYDAAAGALATIQTLDTLPVGAPDNTVADIHLSADATRLYVSNRGHNSIVAYAVAPDGRLAHSATAGCGGAWPRNFALAPGGGYLLVANQHSDHLSVLPLPAMAEPVAAATVPQASCVIFVD